MIHRTRRLGTENYQRSIIEEYGAHGGSTKTAMNMCRTFNVSYNLADTLAPVRGKETILKALRAEHKKAIEDHPHMDESLRAIMFRYLFAIHAESIRTLKAVYVSPRHRK